MESQRPIYSYLPEIYRQDPLLDRLCEALEQMHAAIGEETGGLADKLYEPENTPEPWLGFLGCLVGIQGAARLLTPVQMRALIPVAYGLHQRKGTRAAMQALFACVLQARCGHAVPVWIIEHADWKTLPKKMKDALPDYCAGERDFTVLIGHEPVLQDSRELSRLETLAREYAPVCASAHVLLLPDRAELDGLGVLGLNCWL